MHSDDVVMFVLHSDDVVIFVLHSDDVVMFVLHSDVVVMFVLLFIACNVEPRFYIVFMSINPVFCVVFLDHCLFVCLFYVVCEI